MNRAACILFAVALAGCVATPHQSVPTVATAPTTPAGGINRTQPIQDESSILVPLEFPWGALIMRIQPDKTVWHVGERITGRYSITNATVGTLTIPPSYFPRVVVKKADGQPVPYHESKRPTCGGLRIMGDDAGLELPRQSWYDGEFRIETQVDPEGFAIGGLWDMPAGSYILDFPDLKPTLGVDSISPSVPITVIDKPIPRQ